MADEIEWELVTRYLRGECDASEAARVERWLERPEVRAALGEALRDVDRQAIPVPRVEVERASDRMRSAMGVRTRAASSRARHTWLIAAGVALVAAAVGSALVVGGRGTPAEWREASSATADRQRVSLGDVGDALLAPQSTIRWRERLDEPVEVRLEGEALFDVRHRRGVVVRAGSAIAEDIGTTFLVSARAENDAVRVTVMMGAVRLRDTVDVAWHRVDAEQRGTVAAGAPVRVEPADTTQALAWTRGRLAFVSAPLEEVAQELERWFEVEIEVEPSVARRRLTGEFDAGQPGSLDEILLTITAATDVSAERTAGRVVLRERR